MARLDPIRLAVEVDTAQAERALRDLEQRCADIGGRRPSIVAMAATAAAASASSTRTVSRRALLGLAWKRATA